MSLDASLFISSDIVSKTITMADGSEHVLHFKQLRSADFRRCYAGMNSADQDERSQSLAMLIEASLVNPDGSPAITAEQAAMLKPSVETQITTAIMAVNGFGEQEKKVSERVTKDGSGTSSRSRLAKRSKNSTGR